jgi:hypothetical protein
MTGAWIVWMELLLKLVILCQYNSQIHRVFAGRIVTNKQTMMAIEMVTSCLFVYFWQKIVIIIYYLFICECINAQFLQLYFAVVGKKIDMWSYLKKTFSTYQKCWKTTVVWQWTILRIVFALFWPLWLKIVFRKQMLVFWFTKHFNPFSFPHLGLKVFFKSNGPQSFF